MIYTCSKTQTSIVLWFIPNISVPIMCPVQFDKDLLSICFMLSKFLDSKC